MESYQANETYRYDLDGNGILDLIKYGCVGEHSPVLYINQDMFPLDQARSEVFSENFKIIDLNKTINTVK